MGDNDKQAAAREAVQNLAVSLPELVASAQLEQGARTGAQMLMADALGAVAAAIMAGVLLQARRDGLTREQANAVIAAGYLSAGADMPEFVAEDFGG